MPATLADIQKKYGDSVYPLYKGEAPYMENDNGIGYKGVVMHDEDEDKVQCSECGKWFSDLGTHLGAHGHSSHGITVKDYREKHGLLTSVQLCSKRKSRLLSENMKKRWRRGDMDNSLKNLEKGRVDHGEKIKASKQKMQHKNKFGYCDAQIAARIVIVRDQASKQDISNLAMSDIQKYDHPLYKALVRKYGSLKLAVGALGLSSRLRKKRYTDSEIIALLRNWVMEHKKIPAANDITARKNPIKVGGGYNLGIGTIYNHFGSWRRAKMMAGLDQLLQEVK